MGAPISQGGPQNVEILGPQNVKILGPRGPRILKILGPWGPQNGGALFSHDTGERGYSARIYRQLRPTLAAPISTLYVCPPPFFNLWIRPWRGLTSDHLIFALTSFSNLLAPIVIRHGHMPSCLSDVNVQAIPKGDNKECNNYQGIAQGY